MLDVTHTYLTQRFGEWDHLPHVSAALRSNKNYMRQKHARQMLDMCNNCRQDKGTNSEWIPGLWRGCITPHPAAEYVDWNTWQPNAAQSGFPSDWNESEYQKHLTARGLDSTGTVAKLQARLKEAVIARRIRAWGLLETHYDDIIRCADDGWFSTQLLGKWVVRHTQW